MVLTFYEGLLAEGRERRAEGRVLRAKRYIFPHFTRGLRLHRYFCVALRGFWQRAESEGQRAESEGRRYIIFRILRGAYATIAIIVSP